MEGRFATKDLVNGLHELFGARILQEVANSASLHCGDEGWRISGDPTEAALLTLAGKLGLVASDELARLPRVDAIPFSPELRCTASLHHDHAGHGLISLFGAPERAMAMSRKPSSSRSPTSNP